MGLFTWRLQIQFPRNICNEYFVINYHKIDFIDNDDYSSYVYILSIIIIIKLNSHIHTSLQVNFCFLLFCDMYTKYLTKISWNIKQWHSENFPPFLSHAIHSFVVNQLIEKYSTFFFIHPLTLTSGRFSFCRANV